MYRDVSACNTYNYGDALYWDARYIQEGGSFDWYQRYSALRPFVRKYFPTSSRVLMVGCGNAVMSEDMVKDGYEDIMNIDISSVAIEMMRRKYEHIPQLKYMQMDARDMSFFPDESFDGVIDKGMQESLYYMFCQILQFFLNYIGLMILFALCMHGPLESIVGTLDSLMVICVFQLFLLVVFGLLFASSNLLHMLLTFKCGTDAPISAAQMLGEVSRLLKPGGIYMLITYGDPTVRTPHLSRPVYNWKIELYIIREHTDGQWTLPWMGTPNFIMISVRMLSQFVLLVSYWVVS
ncbi:hypothetical protein ACSBR1_017980 [Camellia fascicularis]